MWRPGPRPGQRAAARSGGAVGLLRGPSGKALLFIRLYERTGETGLPRRRRGCHSRRPGPLRHRPHGALQVDDGWRTLPYLRGGSVGIGMVIDQFTAHRRNAAFAGAARAIGLAASSGLYAQAGLFNGRAGMLAYLAGALDESGQQAARRVAGAHVDRLAWHAVRYAGGLAFPATCCCACDGPGHRHRRCPAGHGRRARPRWRGAAVFRPPARLPVRVLGSSRGAPAGSLQPASTRKEVNLYGSPRHPGDGPRA